MKARVLLGIAMCILMVDSASPFDSTDIFHIGQAGKDIKSAIDQLAQQSQDWQTILPQLENKLIADANSTLANEVSQLLQNGIAAAGGEVRCELDFVGNRMREGLEKI